MGVIFAFIKLIIIAALVKLVLETGKVWICAAVLSGVILFWHLVSGFFVAGLVHALIVFAAAFGYFFLIDRMQGSGAIWIIAALGAVILMAI